MGEYADHLTRLKKNNCLHRVLISHDDGWAVTKNESNGFVTFKPFANGNTIPYQTIPTLFKPYLMQKGFSENDFSTIIVKNPREAFSIKICSIKNRRDFNN